MKIYLSIRKIFLYKQAGMEIFEAINKKIEKTIRKLIAKGISIKSFLIKEWKNTL